MRSNIGLQMVMAAYLAVATIGYVIVSYIIFGYVEPIGTIVIGFSVLLSLLIAFFLYSGLSKDSALPEDRLDGEIADDSGEVGFFSPWSVHRCSISHRGSSWVCLRILTRSSRSLRVHSSCQSGLL
jgi:hypothetical protein